MFCYLDKFDPCFGLFLETYEPTLCMIYMVTWMFLPAQMARFGEIYDLESTIGDTGFRFFD